MSISTKPAGRHLHAELVGEGPPCFLSHGGPGLHHGLYRTLDPLAARGIQTFAVLGHSFGGWVAQELALRHPARVSAPRTQEEIDA